MPMADQEYHPRRSEPFCPLPRDGDRVRGERRKPRSFPGQLLFRRPNTPSPTNGFDRRSAPNVDTGPCPGTNVTSSPSGQSCVVMDSIIEITAGIDDGSPPGFLADEQGAILLEGGDGDQVDFHARHRKRVTAHFRIVGAGRPWNPRAGDAGRKSRRMSGPEKAI